MINGSRSTILLPVFIPAAVIMLLLVIGTAINPEAAGALFSDVLSFTTETFGWFLHAGGCPVFDVHYCTGVFVLWQYQAGP
nr:hypothetical protein [Psychrobacter sp. KH172YL61]